MMVLSTTSPNSSVPPWKMANGSQRALLISG